MHPTEDHSIYNATANNLKRRNCGEFNTPLTVMDRSSRQKINKEAKALNEALDQMDLIDIYRTFHRKAGEYTFLSSAHRTFSRIDHIWATNQASVTLRKLKSYQK